MKLHDKNFDSKNESTGTKTQYFAILMNVAIVIIFLVQCHKFIISVITITIIINISTIATTKTDQVRWYRDSNLLAETDTVSFQTQQNRHTLILRLVPMIIS